MKKAIAELYPPWSISRGSVGAGLVRWILRDLLSDLLAATGGTVHGPVFAEAFTDFCFDTRLLNPGELFLAVVTDKGRWPRLCT